MVWILVGSIVAYGVGCYLLGLCRGLDLGFRQGERHADAIHAARLAAAQRRRAWQHAPRQTAGGRQDTPSDPSDRLTVEQVNGDGNPWF